MKMRYVILLVISAAAFAAFLPGGAYGQDRQGSRPQGPGAVPGSRMLDVLQRGTWQCALPGSAGSAAFEVVEAEGFTIGTASSYRNAQGQGIYLLRGNELTFTRGPKKDERYRRLGNNTVQKIGADGRLSKLICTRVGSGS